MSKPNNCGCCDGIESVTPIAIRNRAGLDQLRYRVGTHSSFFESMLARLTTRCEPLVECRQGDGQRLLLDQLTTRSQTDPAIAMLDAWSIVADILTFYQERIANEGFLRTADERRSLFELSRLVGYRPRPGVSASVFLAFEVEPPPTVTTATGLAAPTPPQPNPNVEILIPKGTQAKSTPAPGTDEQPQTFETLEDFNARPGWNRLRPRQTRPPEITDANALDLEKLYFQGTGLRLSKNDYLILVLDPDQLPYPYQIASVEEDNDRQVTRVGLVNDVLSLQQFLDELRAAIMAFLSDESTIGTLSEAGYRDLRTGLINRIVKAEREQRTLRMTGVDDLFNKLMCEELLTNTPDDSPCALLTIDNRRLLHIFQQLTAWAVHLKHLYGKRDGLMVRTDLTIDSDYLQPHKALREYVIAKKEGLFKPGQDGAPDEGLLPDYRRLFADAIPMIAGATLIAKRHFWSSSFGPTDLSSGDRPQFLIASNGWTLTTTGTLPIVSNDRAHVELGTRYPDYPVVFITCDLISGPLSETTPSNVVPVNASGATVTAEEIISAFENLEVSFTTAGAYWLRVDIRKPQEQDQTLVDEARTGILASLIKQVDVKPTPSSPLPTKPLDALANEKSVVKRDWNKLSAIDSGLTLFTDSSTQPDATYCALIGFLGDDGDDVSFEVDSGFTVTQLIGTPRQWLLSPEPSGSIRTASQFEQALRSLQVAFDSQPHHRFLQFQFFDGDPVADPATAVGLGACLYEIALHRTLPSAIRSRLGELISQLTQTQVPIINAEVEQLVRTFAQEVEFDLDNLSQTPVQFNALIQHLQKIIDASDPTDGDPPDEVELVSKVVQDVEDVGDLPVVASSKTTLTRLRAQISDRRDEISRQLRGEHGSGIPKTGLARLIHFALESSNTPPPLERKNHTVSDLLKKFRETDIKKTFETLNTKAKEPYDLVGLNQLAEAYDKAIFGFDETDNTLVKRIEHEIVRFQAQEVVVLRFATNLLAALIRARKYFATRIISLRESRGAAFEAPESSDQVVKQRLDHVLVAKTDPPNDEPALEERISTLDTAFNRAQAASDPGTGSDQLKNSICCSDYTLTGIVNRINQELLGAQTATLQYLFKNSELTGAGKSALGNILRGWQSFLTKFRRDIGDTVGGQASLRSPDLQSILAELASSSPSALGQLGSLFETNSDLIPQLVAAVSPDLRDKLFALLRSARNTPQHLFEPKVFVLRSEANLFGWNAPTHPATPIVDEPISNVALKVRRGIYLNAAERRRLRENIVKLSEERIHPAFAYLNGSEAEGDSHLFLDGSFKTTEPGSVIAIFEPGRDEPMTYYVDKIEWHPRAAYGIKGKVTHIQTKVPWWNVDSFARLRHVRVLCDAERLELAEEPLEPREIPDLQSFDSNKIELEDLVLGLSIGQPILLSGAPRFSHLRSETRSSELLRVVSVSHDYRPETYGDRLHTTLTFSKPLNSVYWRDSVNLFANVVEATHGQTRQEVLGSGDFRKEFQRFPLQKPPLTYLPGPTPTGVQDTLEIQVNDVTWTQRDSFNESSGDALHYVTVPSQVQGVHPVFGDGKQGARLPTGLDNVRVKYRSGIGDAGNVDADRVDQLVGAPLGVKGVLNPVAADGGADPDGTDMVRARTPLGLSALDRIVSARDYADFARSYAGIGKASASPIGGVVYVTVAAMRSKPLLMDGQLVTNLRSAMRLHGEPLQRFTVLNREVVLLLIHAGVAIRTEYAWQDVHRRIRRALLERFSYERAALGQDVLRSDAIQTIMDVEGVEYVDIDAFSSVAEEDALRLADDKQIGGSPQGSDASEESDPARLTLLRQQARQQLSRIVVNYARPSVIRRSTGSDSSPQTQAAVRAAELCYLTPDVPDTLILEQLA